MVCSKFSSLEGCGKCKVLLNDVSKLNKIEPKAMRIITMKIGKTLGEVRNNKANVLSISTSVLKCDGKMSLHFKPNDNTNNESNIDSNARIELANINNENIMVEMLTNWLANKDKELDNTHAIMNVCIALYFFNNRRDDPNGCANMRNLAIIINEMLDNNGVYTTRR